MRARAGLDRDPDDPGREDALSAAAGEAAHQGNGAPRPPIRLGRYLCPDPWCEHAANPHSHGRP